MPTVASLCSSFSSTVLDAVYPAKCSLCGLLAPTSPCEQCEGEMRPLTPLVQIETEGPLDFRVALYGYEGRAGQAVRRLKYSRSTSLGDFMAERIAEAASELLYDAVVPVPIHGSRRRQRGFNQAEMLAAKLVTRPELLTRIRRTRPQVGLNREQRLRNLAGAFKASEEVKGLSILLVDDVITSGQTANECARVLRAAGATYVGILAFCGEAETADY